MRISDWSSDVCSSDLPLIFTASFHATDCSPSLGFQWNLTKVERSFASTNRKVWTPKPSMKRKERGIERSDITHMITCRSDERRVGEECGSTGRYWWAPVR